MSKDNKVASLDIELLNGYLQTLDRSVIEKMITLYSQQSLIYIEKIEEALTNQGITLWHESCHKMKGAAGSVGLLSLHARLQAMEKLSGTNTEKAQQLAELKLHNVKAIEEFNQWLAKKT